ncbi:MAG: DUF167 domain-containing protein [Myxococcota bacterium]|nr:DUF167 domain-containing protein [Myxococcota bacterium]
MSERPEAPAFRVETGRDWAGFWIHVTPRARSERVGGAHGDALRVAVKAPPVEGKANRACIALLAEALGLPRSAVDLDPGARGRRKRVRARGDPAQLATRLASLAGDAGLR